jgi:hypothetical protein
MAVKFDFDSIKQRVLDSLKAKSEWADILPYGVLDNLITVICQEMAYEVQYKEYLTFENWWALARNRSSLLAIAPVLNYAIEKKVGAIGTVRVSSDKDFAGTHTSNIPIPKYFQFGNTTLFVIAKQDYVIPFTMNYLDLDVIQGERKYLQFIPQGINFETKEIIEDSLENSYYDLYVNDIKWEPIDTLYNAEASSLVYQIKIDSALTKITLCFGNDVFGKKLKATDTVKFFYVSTKGDEGNIHALNSINKVISQAIDINGSPVKLYVKNITPILGGQGYPNLEDVREIAPKVFQTGDRASSKADYEIIISQFNYITKSMVWGVYETLKDDGLDPWTFIPTKENVVHIAALNNLYENLSSIEKNYVIEDLHSRCDPTDIIQFELVEKVMLYFTVNAIVKNSSYSLDTVKGLIEQALIDNYSIETTTFGEPLYNSDLVRLIDEVDGVRNHNTLVEGQKTMGFSEAYLSSFTLPLAPLLGDKIRIYIKRAIDPDTSYTLIGTGDISGVITGVGIYVFQDSIVDLNNGNGLIIITNGLTLPFTDYTIQCIYQRAEDDILLSKRNYILEYAGSAIAVSYPTQ